MCTSSQLMVIDWSSPLQALWSETWTVTAYYQLVIFDERVACFQLQVIWSVTAL